jgi:hypothetical protein
MKAYCIWCESGNGVPTKSGYYWIHDTCSNEMIDHCFHNSKCIREILEGKHPRNKENEGKLDTILRFISDMEQFEKRWRNTMKKLHPQISAELSLIATTKCD